MISPDLAAAESTWVVLVRLGLATGYMCFDVVLGSLFSFKVRLERTRCSMRLGTMGLWWLMTPWGWG